MKNINDELEYICINDDFEPLSGIKAKLNEVYIFYVSVYSGNRIVLKSDILGAITIDNSTEVDDEIFSNHFMELRLYKITKLKKLL
jgi:hypothetical protein